MCGGSMSDKITKQKCNVCSKVKPLTDFVKRATEKNGYRKVCKACHKAKQLAYKEKYPDKIKDQKLRQTLGVSLDQKRSMMEKQKHVCPICHSDLDKVRFTPVDHCHNTGKIRGVLCGNCNIGIGHLKDSISNLFRAAMYLLKNRF
jgi:protein-arginine kinase activator protein McsA